MILRSDDDIYVVDQRWYGPPGRTLPWAARYAAYGWGFVLYLLAMVIERVVLRIPLSPQSVLFTLIGVALITTHLMRKVNPDRPMMSVVRGYWHELRTPRPGAGRRRGVHPDRSPRRVSMSLVRPPHSRLPDPIDAQLSRPGMR